MRITDKISIITHFFVGTGALAGGTAAIVNPYDPMGVNSGELLKYAPFSDFLLPGLILFAIIGLGNITAGFMLFTKWTIRPITSGFFAVTLIFWIVVQCVILQSIAVLHVIFFMTGIFQGILSLFLLDPQAR